MGKKITQQIITFFCLRVIVISGETYTWMAALNRYLLIPIGIYVRFDQGKGEYEIKRNK